MKRRNCRLLAVLLCLALLTGCGKVPERAADGSDWDESWISLGGVLGAEVPGDGLTLRDNNTALTASDMYYASWVAGEAGPYTNADGEEVELYGAQLDVLVYGCKDAEAAETIVSEWTERQQSLYNVTGTREQTCNGQTYSLSVYTIASDSNPFSRGAAAFTVYDCYAVTAEMNCQTDFSGDAAAILARFLEGCHYNAEL